MIRNALAVIACILMTVGIADAGYKSRQSSCNADIRKLCSNVTPGDGRIYQCLTSHDLELSSGCRDRLARAQTRYDQLTQACNADAGKYCNDVQPGQGRVLACLNDQEANLSSACRAELAQARSDTALSQ